MEAQLIVIDSYFDGKHYRNKGPYTIELQEGIIRSIGEGAVSPDIPGVKRASFAMPGLVEAHCHLFLDGGELDFAKRQEIWHEVHALIYREQPFLFLYNAPRKFALSKNVRGVQTFALRPGYNPVKWYYPKGTPGTRPTLGKE